MTEPVTTPVVVSASPAKALAGTAIGAALVVATSFPTLLSLLGTRDVLAILRWLQGVEGASFIAAGGLIGTLAWRFIGSARKHLRLVTVAREVDDRVGIVLEKVA